MFLHIFQFLCIVFLSIFFKTIFYFFKELFYLYIYISDFLQIFHIFCMFYALLRFLRFFKILILGNYIVIPKPFPTKPRLVR